MSDVEDPCVEAVELRALRRALITGEALSESRFGEDMVRFASADMAGLERLIKDAEDRCAAFTGEKPKRRRQAFGARFRPY